MGVQWRRVTEGAMQKLNLTDKNFVPTSNERNEKMLREAAAFDAHLKRLEGSIKDAKGASEGEQCMPHTERCDLGQEVDFIMVSSVRSIIHGHNDPVLVRHSLKWSVEARLDKCVFDVCVRRTNYAG